MSTNYEIAHDIVSEILADVEDGIVPAGIKEFSELHQYVDANDYLLLCCKQADGEDYDAWIKRCNEVCDEVNRQLAEIRQEGIY